MKEFFVFALLATSIFADSVEVTNYDDSGPGTLRAAMTAPADPRTITFDNTAQPITLSSALPDVTTTMTIDGGIQIFPVGETIFNIPSGSLTLKDGLLLFGNVVTNTTLNADSTNAILGLYGEISGTGGLLCSGNILHSCQLDGNNTFTGSTAISSGRVVVFNSSALSTTSGVEVQDGATLRLATDATVRNLSGAGSVRLDNVTAYNLTLSQTADTTFSGTINSTGSLIKEGASQFTLSGTNTYTGTTTVSAGTLNVTGSIANSTLTVGSSGTVRGIGTLGPTTVNGTMYPGQSIGTITVSGNYTQAAGSKLIVEVDADGNASKVAATGSATIGSNTTVEISPLVGDYEEDHTYTILSATNGVTGTFTTLTNLNAAEIDGGGLALQYTSNAVQLLFTAAPDTTLGYLAPSMVNQAIHFQANILSYENDMRIMTRPRCCDKQYYLFAIGDYGFGHVEETASMTASSYQVGGIDLGFGFQLGCWDLGLIGAYSRSDAKAYNKKGEGTGNNYYGGIFARYYHPIATITMEGLGGYNDLDLEKKADGAVINKASPDGKSMLLEAKIAFNYGNSVKARPIIGARYIWEDVPSYTEELATKKQEYSGFKQDLAEGLIGILLYSERNVRGVGIQPHIRLLWIEEFLTKAENITVTRIATPPSDKTERVAFGERGYLQLTGGLSVTLSNCLNIDVTGETNFFRREAPTADFRGRLSYSF